MKSNFNINHNKAEFRLFVAGMYPQLIKLKQNGYRESFNQVLLKITLKLRVYIKNYIDLAYKQGAFSKEKYTTKDITSALFLEIYDCIEDVQNDQDLYVWLYDTTHILLKDISQEDGVSDTFYKNIENFSHEDWDKMEENYNSSQDSIGQHDHSDRHFNHSNYILDYVFVENKINDSKGQLYETLQSDPVKTHMAMVLNNLPTEMRDVFELYTNEYLELNEIAKIKNSTIEKVKTLLNKTSTALKLSIFNRYFN
jgi:DNA-directed RNA polymerase specialized sigma24 family protein